MKTNDYRPIACDTYSSYELAILRRRRLRLAWSEADGAVVHNRIVTPLDLRTRDGEEFLIARDGDRGTIEVRLDRIRRVEEL